MYGLGKAIAAGTFVLAVPFFVFAQGTGTPAQTALAPPAFIKDIKTKEDVAKLTPEQQKQYLEYMQEKAAQEQSNAQLAKQPASAAASNQNPAGQTSSPFSSLLTPKMLIALIPLLIVIGVVIYLALKRRMARGQFQS